MTDTNLCTCVKPPWHKVRPPTEIRGPYADQRWWLICTACWGFVKPASKKETEALWASKQRC